MADFKVGDKTWTVKNSDLPLGFRVPQHHEVKSWTFLFEPLMLGIKKHDIRDMRDRDYRIGDTMTLHEFDMVSGAYTGRSQDVEITYITDRDHACAFSGSVLDRNYGILSLKLIGGVKET